MKYVSFIHIQCVINPTGYMAISLSFLLWVNIYILGSFAVSKNSAMKLSYSSYAHMLQSL